MYDYLALFDLISVFLLRFVLLVKNRNRKTIIEALQNPRILKGATIARSVDAFWVSLPLNYAGDSSNLHILPDTDSLWKILKAVAVTGEGIYANERKIMFYSSFWKAALLKGDKVGLVIWLGKSFHSEVDNLGIAVRSMTQKVSPEMQA